jgi:hypothetical protein
VNRHGSSLPEAGSVKAGELFYKTDENKLYAFNEGAGEWGAVNIEELADLSDVDSATQADGNVLASGGGNYRGESISQLATDHIEHTDLATSPTDAHHNRDHQSRHHRGNDDELLVTLLPSGSPSNQNVVLHPDGSGGTRWKIPLDGVSKLSQSISSPPTQTEVQNIQDKVNEVIENLK